MKKTTIFIADDHPYIREGVRTIFTNLPDYEVVGEGEDGIDAMNSVLEIRPDIVIMDITMPRLSGIEATRRIVEELKDTRVIILSMHADPIHAIDAFRAGATGYTLKDSPPGELLKAVEKVRAGSKYASPEVAEELINDFVEVIRKGKSNDPFDTLSDREKEVLKLIAEGETSREIADRLFISLATVKSHRNNLMKKLEVNDMAGLIKLAIRKGIVSP